MRTADGTCIGSKHRRDENVPPDKELAIDPKKFLLERKLEEQCSHGWRACSRRIRKQRILQFIQLMLPATDFLLFAHPIWKKRVSNGNRSTRCICYTVPSVRFL
jgi:hypothetical protein